MLHATKTLAIISALGMALPPAWCCGIMQLEQCFARPTESRCCGHCCQRHKLNQPPKSLPCPTCPNFKMCVKRDAALPTKRVQQSQAPIIAIPIAICEVAFVAGCPDPIAAVLPHPVRPPTHVLLCIWRC